MSKEYQVSENSFKNLKSEKSESLILVGFEPTILNP